MDGGQQKKDRWDRLSSYGNIFIDCSEVRCCAPHTYSPHPGAKVKQQEAIDNALEQILLGPCLESIDDMGEENLDEWMLKVCQVRNLSQYAFVRLPTQIKRSYVRTLFFEKPYDTFRSTLVDAVDARMAVLDACSSKQLNDKYVQTMSRINKSSGLVVLDLRSMYKDSHTVAGHIRFASESKQHEQLRDLIMNWQLDQEWRLEEATAELGKCDSPADKAGVLNEHLPGRGYTAAMFEEHEEEAEEDELDEEVTMDSQANFRGTEQTGVQQTDKNKKLNNYYNKKMKAERERKKQETIYRMR